MRRFYHYFIVIIGLLFFAAANLMLQKQLMFWSDPSWLMQASARLLAGKRYYYDIFETNPPWILWLHAPAVLLKQYYALTTATAVNLYTSLMAVISLLFSFYLLAKLASKLTIKHSTLAYSIFFISIGFAFFILPTHAFAQREHFLCILIFPYFIANAAELYQLKLPIILRLMVGLLAAAGFAIKPYFFITFILIELYMLWQKRSIKVLFRAELLAFYAFMLLYALYLIYIAPEYLYKVLPFTTKFYLGLFGHEHYSFYFYLSPPCFYIYLIFACYLCKLYQRKTDYIANLLALACLGFYLGYLVQNTIWYYHLLPALIFSLILHAWLMLLAYQNSRLERYFYGALLGLFFIVTLCTQTIISKQDKYFIDNYLQPLSKLIQENHGDRDFYAIATTLGLYYPLTDYAQVNCSSRFPAVFFLVRPLRWLFSHDPIKQARGEYYANQFAYMIHQDLKRQQPHLLLIEDVQSQIYPARDANMLHWLHTNPILRNDLKHYRFLTKKWRFLFYVKKP